MSKKEAHASGGPQRPPNPNLFALLKPYQGMILVLVLLTVAANGLNLAVPKIIGGAIDSYSQGTYVLTRFLITFSSVAILIFLITYVQSLIQTYAAEKVGRDLRTKLIAKISGQNQAFITKATPAQLLTNLTSDVDAVKAFVSQAIATIISSVVLIIGASTLLIITDWRLGLAVLAVIPIIGGAFFFIFSKVKTLFVRAQGTIDWLNKVINESILGAALIRLVNAQEYEYQKFLSANTEARNVSLSILNLFASLIPIITFFTNLATLTILVLGGRYIIGGSLSLGDFTAFNNYLAILIFPIIILGFMSTVIAQATASYGRIKHVLDAEDAKSEGTITKAIAGGVSMENITLVLGDKKILKSISFDVAPGTRTAIIGPTAAGKTQLLYVLAGLVEPTDGIVRFDGTPLAEYSKETLHEKIGFVFQDSVLFNLTLRENIAFNTKVKDSALEKAVTTAELGDFLDTLPKGLDTVVSERGTSLSGGQKQRVMLARALALDPAILLLDDFTARVDGRTEKKILENVHTNYPHTTLISVTQKISSVESYDQIIVIMEGEILARGTHDELMRTSPEYVQIYDSQHSTHHYELHA